LVKHNGGSSPGQFTYTLTVTDVVTGYPRRRALLGKSQLAVLRELQHILSEWPMQPWGIHCDNGQDKDPLALHDQLEKCFPVL